MTRPIHRAQRTTHNAQGAKLVGRCDLCVVRCALCATFLCLLASTAWTAPYDLVPRGDWSYDLLSSIARRGLLPGVSARSLHGDELRTRADQAELVAQAAESADQLPPGMRATLAQLVREYRPELGTRAEALLGQIKAPDRGAFAGGYLLGRVVAGDGTALSGIYRADGAAAINRYLLATVSGTNERRLWSEKPNAFNDLERLTLRLETRLVTWELGKRDDYWGPGYGGAMLISDNAPGFLQMRGEALLKLGFLGNWRLVQTVGTFTETGGRKYVVARRFSRMFGRRFGLSLSEAVKTNTTRDLYLSLVLPLYGYGKVLDNDVRNSERLNYLANIDAWYSLGRVVAVYGDFLLDDVTAPFNLGPVDVARKIGYLLGVQVRPAPRSDRTDVRLEYAFTDGNTPGFPPEGGTYWHRNPDLAWYDHGLTMGHRMARNRRGPFARVRHRFAQRFTAIAEWEDETQFRATPVVGDRRRLTLYGAYDLRPDRSLALGVDRLGGALGDDTFVQLQASISF
jgi:Capsule assembly protein Wzi